MCPRVQTADANFNDIKFSGDLLPRLSLYDTSGYSSQTLATSLVFKEHGPATMPPRFKSSCVCADHPGMVGLGGLEPPASPLSGVRSNHLSYRPNVFPSMVEPVGIEPTTPCLQSRCSPS